MHFFGGDFESLWCVISAKKYPAFFLYYFYYSLPRLFLYHYGLSRPSFSLIFGSFFPQFTVELDVRMRMIAQTTKYAHWAKIWVKCHSGKLHCFLIQRLKSMFFWNFLKGSSEEWRKKFQKHYLSLEFYYKALTIEQF